MEIKNINITSIILNSYINMTDTKKDEPDEPAHKLSIDQEDMAPLLVPDNKNLMINKISQENIQTKAIQKTEKVETNNEQKTKANTGKNETIDWNLLTIEGKGINIGNLAKVLAKASEDSGKKNTSLVIKYINKNGTEEEKNALKKLFSAVDEDTVEGNTIFNKMETSSNAMSLLFNVFDSTNKKDILGSSVNSIVNNIAHLSKYDYDGDGFLSDDEINAMTGLSSNKQSGNIINNSSLPTEKEKKEIDLFFNNSPWITNKYGVDKNGNPTDGCTSTSFFATEKLYKTTVDGKIAFVVQGQKNAMIITQEEFEALDKYYAQNGDKADYEGAIAAMQCKSNGLIAASKKVANDSFTNSLGIDSLVGACRIIKSSSSTGEINKTAPLGVTNKWNSSSECLWYMFKVIKNHLA